MIIYSFFKSIVEPLPILQNVAVHDLPDPFQQKQVLLVSIQKVGVAENLVDLPLAQVLGQRLVREVEGKISGLKGYFCSML